ncbi:hypothetical protein H2Y54_21335 [Pectobacterium aroidearum]|uniref:hypothetical protein n=1 Tax=Pectobacterium aroidearum TaxID=1201031 RepID=UPI0015F0E953|nr:hypothetical protein [Pectobacterium aroidearum]MBA5239061.1 hypothetical protein [Pectobacterium aroidearum]
MSNYGKIIGAGVAGLVTLAGTYFLGRSNGEEEGFAEGRQASKAEYAEKLKKFQAEVANQVADIGKRDYFILAAYALGSCCLKANGQHTEENIKILEDLVSGLVPRDKLPKIVQENIEEMIENPLNLPTVWALINKYQLNDAKSLTIFGEIVDVMTSLDALKTQSEIDFMASWNLLVAA